MPAGLLTPDPRLRELSDLGVVLPGALLHTYVSGTPSTPLATTSDAAGLVPNLNPLVASAGGLFGPIYLTTGLAYKLVLTDANGVEIWSQDPVGLGGVTQGGTGAVTLTAHGVLVGAGTGAIVATAAGTAGQPLRSNGAAADPSFGEVIQTTTLTGTQNDFVLTAGCRVLRCNNATLLTITGFAAGYDGQRVVIESIGAGQVDLVPQTTAGSVAANRVITFVTVGNTSLAAGVGTAELVYDVTTTRWRLTAHGQGDWISYAGTSTIVGWSARTITRLVYMLEGRKLTVSWYLAGTSNSAAASFTIPYTAQNAGSGGDTGPGAGVMGVTIDNGAYTATPGQVGINDSTAIVNMWASMSRTNYSAIGAKTAAGSLVIAVQ